LRNRVTYKLFGLLALGCRRTLLAERARLGLPRERPEPTANVTTCPRELDYPRVYTQPTLHFVGPIADRAKRQKVDFPFEKLDGRQLIYASLGTLLGGNTRIFRAIADACAGIPDVQLVISMGGSEPPRELQELPGAPIVVKFAPQIELLDRAALCICHAGANSAFEALAAGVPILAIPLMNDAPGVAARVVWAGCGELIKPSKVSSPRLRASIQRIMMDPTFKASAARLQECIRQSGGVSEAADIFCGVANNARTE
jgi:MGT family glycosyltransferase